MLKETIDLATGDGAMATQIFTPDGSSAPKRAVILCHDAGGPRKPMSDIAERIAAWSFLVALPDFFHRVGPVTQLLPPGADPATMLLAIFTDKDTFAKFRKTWYASATNPEHIRTDVAAVLDHLDGRADVDHAHGVGTTGYCMGGNISIRVATLFGERIAAAASFHGGGIANQAPDSPHRAAGQIKARVYVAGAIEDPSFTDDMKTDLIAALEAAHVDATVETYPARHGFAVTDNPTFDAAAAERHYAALEGLFKTRQGQG